LLGWTVRLLYSLLFYCIFSEKERDRTIRHSIREVGAFFDIYRCSPTPFVSGLGGICSPTTYCIRQSVSLSTVPESVEFILEAAHRDCVACQYPRGLERKIIELDL
jgi:hypothetical protein